jgi:hypothetical protein
MHYLQLSNPNSAASNDLYQQFVNAMPRSRNGEQIQVNLIGFSGGGVAVNTLAVRAEDDPQLAERGVRVERMATAGSPLPSFMSRTPSRIQVYNYTSSGDEVLTWVPVLPFMRGRSPHLDSNDAERRFGPEIRHSDWPDNSDFLNQLHRDLQTPVPGAPVPPQTSPVPAAGLMGGNIIPFPQRQAACMA